MIREGIQTASNWPLVPDRQGCWNWRPKARAAAVGATWLALAFLTASPTSAAPVVTFATAAGEPTSLATFRGRFVLVDIWASWCAPCVAALPQLADIHRKYGNHVSIVPISIDREGAGRAVNSYARMGVLGLPLYVGEAEKITKAFDAQILPMSILYDKRGREVARLRSAATRGSVELEQALIKLMKINHR